MKSVFLLAALAAAHAQTPAFEVASIKPSDPAGPISIRRSGYRIATTGSSLRPFEGRFLSAPLMLRHRPHS